MNRNLLTLALTVVSAAALALPPLASASEPLHLNPTPAGVVPIHGSTVVLSDTSGSTFHCDLASGSATFEAGGTTGHMNLTFGHDCRESAFNTTCKSTGSTAGTIATTTLPFHLVTLPNDKPGVLITPNQTEPKALAHIECAGGFIKYTVTGSGLIGTIENECGEVFNGLMIDFNATSHGVQEHTTVAGTTTEYDLLRGTGTTALDTTLTATLSEETELECT